MAEPAAENDAGLLLDMWLAALIPDEGAAEG